MLYTNPKHDYSDYVMEELGIDTKALKAAPNDKTGKAEQPAQVPAPNSPKQKSTTSKLK
jgi:outer membrane protein